MVLCAFMSLPVLNKLVSKCTYICILFIITGIKWLPKKYRNWWKTQRRHKITLQRKKLSGYGTNYGAAFSTYENKTGRTCLDGDTRKKFN